TLALAVTGLPTVEFGNHTVQIGALRDAMAVAAMGGDDTVAVLERAADADRHGFLANIAVQDPEYFAGVVIGRGALLKAPDGQHPAQHLTLLFGRQVSGDACHDVPTPR